MSQMHTDTSSLSHVGPSMTPTSVAGMSIGQYLIQRLQDYGISDVFGIPGDYVLSLYNMLCESPINVVLQRGPCRVRRRRVCPCAWYGCGLRDLLRGRAEHL